MTMPSSRTAPTSFDAFYRRHVQAVASYVRRRVPPEDSQDIVAQVFVVAWRRFDDLPLPPADRLWLFGVARRTVADHRRSTVRRYRLYDRLRTEQTIRGPMPGDLGGLQPRTEMALSALREQDREVLRMIVWEGMNHVQVAESLGCSPNAVELRYRRARERLRTALQSTGVRSSARVEPLRPAALPADHSEGGLMPRALITGITGQDGRYLAELLVGKGYQVTGLIRGQNNPKARIVQDEIPEIELISGDLTDLSSLIAAVEQVQPDEVYNLGAISFVKLSFSQPELTADVTGSGVLRMLEAIRIVGGSNNPIRFYQASSSEMFGQVHEVPQSEETPFHPRSPYGTAKGFGFHTTVNYREAYGIHASNGILFNHTSPRRGLEFVERKISNAVARISLGLQEGLALGNLDAERDFGYAGDYVDAMWRMLQQSDPGDFVVATGRTWSVRQILSICFEAIGIEDWSPYVTTDDRFLRPADVDHLVGDSSRARRALQWVPTMEFPDVLAAMVESDIEIEKARSALP
jgi:GDPmannose 4,6-dehydratase